MALEGNAGRRLGQVLAEAVKVGGWGGGWARRLAARPAGAQTGGRPRGCCASSPRADPPRRPARALWLHETRALALAGSSGPRRRALAPTPGLPPQLWRPIRARSGPRNSNITMSRAPMTAGPAGAQAAQAGALGSCLAGAPGGGGRRRRRGGRRRRRRPRAAAGPARSKGAREGGGAGGGGGLWGQGPPHRRRAGRLGRVGAQ